MIPLTRPGDRPPARSPPATRGRRALAELAAPPPSPLTLVPQARPARPRRRDRPGQLGERQLLLVRQPERELGHPLAHVRLLAGVSQVDLQPAAPPLAALARRHVP